jgi:hypothetical protein
MDSAEIKRMILKESESHPYVKSLLGDKARQQLNNSDDVFEMGTAFEKMVETKGWNYVEEYIIRNANPIGMLINDNKDENQRGVAKGLVQLMQFVDLAIKAKERIEAERDAKQ